VDAAIRVIHRDGYGAASTALIAQEAGITRGAILHHFGTRKELMAEVVRDAFRRDVGDYRALMAELQIGSRTSDWVELCWRVFSRPSGLATLEILLASRSDPELFAIVHPMQTALEGEAMSQLAKLLTSDPKIVLPRMRMIVWAVRGLMIGRIFLDDPAKMEDVAELLRDWLRAAEIAAAPIAVQTRTLPPDT
jgi:AcrR family transcriptional regulator